MNINSKKVSSWIAVASLATVLAACGGGSGGGSSDSSNTVTPGDTNAGGDNVSTQPITPIVVNDFSFPTIAEANGVVDVTIPDGPLPTFSARRTLSAGTGSAVGFGDPVVLQYSMYSWTTGELVETTDSFDEAVSVRAGVTEGIPDYLSKSLLGRNIGDKMQIIFKSGMEDLPDYLDNSDAYILVLDLI